MTTRELEPTGSPARVLILSAEIGEGHLSAARALACEVHAADPQASVTVVNELGVLGDRLAGKLKRGFQRHLSRADWAYHLTYVLFMASSLARRAGEYGLFRAGGEHLSSVITDHRPTVVVSTYPVITATLGELRRHGMLDVPTCAVITDLGGLHFWAHRGIDLHLAMYERSLGEIARIAGPGRARHVRPLVAREFFSARAPERALSALGLPADRPLVLVSGGGWAVGDLEGAARAALRLPRANIIVLTARQETKRRDLSGRFADQARVQVWGFTERMSDLLAAASVLVDTTSGVTCLEAKVRGCPTICYGAPRGHIGANARALARHASIPRAATPTELAALLRETVSRRRGRPQEHWAGLPAAGPLVLELANAQPRAANRDSGDRDSASGRIAIRPALHGAPR